MKLSALKQYLPRSLFGRSLLILVTPVFIIQVFTTYMFFNRHWDEMTGRLSHALAGEIAVISERYEQQRDYSFPDPVTVYAARYLDLDVRFEHGGTMTEQQKKYHVWEGIVVKSLSKAMEEKVRRPYRIDLSIRDKWVQIMVQLDNGVLHVSCPHRRLFSSSGYIFLLWMAGSSILMVIIAILFMRNQIRPIRKLAVAAEWYGKGRDVSFFKPSGAREVRAAAKAFQTMKERIDRQIQQRTAMLAGVSHDLRTPLTRMKLQAAMMGDSREAQDLRADIEEMERMINAYLDFARGAGQEEPARTDLAAFVRRVAQSAARGKDTVYVETQEDIVLMIRPVAFERCLNNLIGNALAYAQHVWIGLRRDAESGMAVLTIDDDGPGIPPHQMEDVFKPFFRGDASRSKKTGGVGLGLPIAQDIVHGHGGEISLSRSDKGGLHVLITLPL